MADPYSLNIAELAARLRSRTLGAVDLTEHAIARHLRHAALNAYKHFDAEAARAQARAADKAFARGTDLGPLQGIPVSIKDLFGVAGMPIFGGSPRRLPACFETEGPIVRALRAQGAVIVGKAHTVEFAFDGLGVNQHWGAPVNPWHPNEHRLTGGSSSGAGVSLHEGSAWLSIGTDSGGSVRMPASWSGAVGLKMTRGRWSLDGLVPCSPTLDSPGPIARSVEEVALAFAALDPVADGARVRAQVRAAKPGDFTIGVADAHFWDDADAGVAECVKAALDELARAGAPIVRVAFPEALAAYGENLGKTISYVEFRGSMEPDFAEWWDLFGPILKGRMSGAEDPRAIPAIVYFHALERQKTLAASAARRFETVDVIACPTVVSSPPREDEVRTLETHAGPNRRVHRNTYLVNVLGLCALSMPVGLDARNMPVGMQLIAAARQEEKLLAAAAAFERVLGAPAKRLGTAPRCR